MGEAGEFQKVLKEKYGQLPRYRLDKPTEDRIQEIIAILDFWTISTTTPEEIKPIMQNHAVTYLATETLPVDEIMSRVALNCLGAPTQFSNWMAGALDGLQNCTQTIGGNPITIYTGERTQPTIASWIADYERYAQNHKSSGAIMIAEYLAKSPNIRTLTEAERGQITKLFRWFNILRFGEGPTAPIQTEDRPIRRVPIQATVTRPVAQPPPVAPSIQPSVAPMPRPVPPPPPPVQPPPVKPATLEAELEASLRRDAQLIRHFEDQARRLIEARPADESFVPTVYQAWDAKDSARAAAALINVSRQSGLISLIDFAEFKTVLGSAIGPRLIQDLTAPAERINRALALPSNRPVLLKEFIKIILTSAAGNDTSAARLMVHLASLVPEDQLGPEASYAFYDIKSKQFRWSATVLNQTDGTLTSKIE